MGAKGVGFQYKSFEKLTLELSEAYCCFKLYEKDYLLDPLKIWWCFLGADCNVSMPRMSACSEKKKEAMNLKVDSLMSSQVVALPGIADSMQLEMRI